MHWAGRKRLAIITCGGGFVKSRNGKRLFWAKRVIIWAKKI